ncbi:hypothetical protein ABPG77_011349 [Micractinium sp. CCAP 211/92]
MSQGPQSSGAELESRIYPHIDRFFPGLEQVHAEPPVYVAHGFLSDDECSLLRQAATAGQLQPLPYDNKALVDTHRLWPLACVVAAGAAFDAWHGLGGDAAPTGAALLAAAGPALLRWTVLVGGLLGATLAGLNFTVGGRVFTGTKWTVTKLDPAHATAPVVSRFIHRTSRLLGTPIDRLEPPTVTRYERGQYQRRHFDARPDGDPAGLKTFLEAGGQRLVQIVVYLNTLEREQGGGTHFHHPCMDGLTVQPRLGDALVFFPAYADGKFDDRMAHSGEAVRLGEKWILNTWACQRRVPAAVTHLPLPQDADA